MKVIKVKTKEHLKLEVEFDDGVQEEVRIESGHLFGVFEQLKNPEFFSQVTFSEGFVAWPGDVDLAPDAMYEEIKKNGAWILR